MDKQKNILHCPLIKLTSDFEVYQDVLNTLHEQKDKKDRKRYLFLGISISSAVYTLLFAIFSFANELNYIGTINIYVFCISILAVLIISSFIKEGKR